MNFTKILRNILRRRRRRNHTNDLLAYSASCLHAIIYKLSFNLFKYIFKKHYTKLANCTVCISELVVHFSIVFVSFNSVIIGSIYFVTDTVENARKIFICIP